ncbi:hypothetical protein [Parapedobacter sp. DT-150]|uniref:hypothetical protein n=1 Tax=Parapedobacter sp. DT-150 TaxID=3396162 RepID=UPI003F1CFC66
MVSIKMRSTTLFALVLLGLTLLSACKKHWEDDKLHIARESYTGNQLRIDGYYLTGNAILGIYIFYENGTLLVGDSFNVDKLAAKEAEIPRFRQVSRPNSSTLTISVGRAMAS